MARANTSDTTHRSRWLTFWRTTFVLYAIALAIGSHWPRLEFGPEVPATDKQIHLFAYAGLTFLLWRTKRLRSRWLAGLVALIWAGAFELTQGIPILQRTIAVDDMFANMLGVIVGLTWLWALIPMDRQHWRIAPLRRWLRPLVLLMVVLELCGILLMIDFSFDILPFHLRAVDATDEADKTRQALMQAGILIAMAAAARAACGLAHRPLAA